MALRLCLRIDVHRPVSEVFAYTADLLNLPDWAGGVQGCEQLDEGPPAAGTRYRVTAKPPAGRPIDSTYVLRAYRENEAFGGDGSFGPIPFREVYHFVERPDGTDIRYVVAMRPRGVVRLPRPVLAMFLRLLIGSDLRRLKRRLEAGAAHPS